MQFTFGAPQPIVNGTSASVGADPEYAATPSRYGHRPGDLEPAEKTQSVLEAGERQSASQARQHRRLIRALRPSGDDSTSVGDAPRAAAADLGIEAGGRGFEALTGVVVAAVTAAEAADGETL